MLRRITIATLCTFAVTALTVETVNARDSKSGSKACRSGQQVSIVSTASGKVRHSWSKGPPHLGFKVSRLNLPGQLNDTRYTKTAMRSIYWQVLARDGAIEGKIQEAYAVCEAF